MRLDWFQKEAVEFAIRTKCCALYMEQGTGKTWVSFGILEKLMAPDLEGLVVGLLNNLETTWWDNLRELFPQLNVTRDWEEYKKLPKPKLLLCHYEYLVKHDTKLARRQWSFIIVDESQRLKNRSSQSSRAIRKLRHQSPYKIILSGTPDDGDPIHYWAQFRFIAPEVFGDVWSDFDEEYLKPTGYMGYKRMMRPAMRPAFEKAIRPHVLVVTNEVLKLEEPKHVRLFVKMPPELREHYDTMEDHLVVALKDQILTAQLPVTKTVKLQQLSSGFIYDEEHKAHRISNFKTAALKRVIDRHESEQIVVFCKFLPEIMSIRRFLRRRGKTVAVIKGGAKHKKHRPQIQRDFQAGGYDVAICQIRSGVGIDLFSASVAVFYSTGHSSIDFQQSKARIYRRGQTRRVTYYYLMAKNSIDEDIQLALKEKRSVSKTILERMKTRLTKGKSHGTTESESCRHRRHETGRR